MVASYNFLPVQFGSHNVLFMLTCLPSEVCLTGGEAKTSILAHTPVCAESAEWSADFTLATFGFVCDFSWFLPASFIIYQAITF